MLSLIKQIIPQSVRNIYHLSQGIVAVTYFGNPSSRLKIIGVTGTDGKTTTSTLIYHLLKNAGFKVALISTVAAYIGEEEIDTGFHVTSPDPWELQKLLAKIISVRFDYVVLESTSHGLDQHRLYGINPFIAVHTNITHEHLDYHKTYENYVHAKAKLFQRSKHAVLNGDDSSFTKLTPLLPPHVQIHKYTNATLTGKLKDAVTKRFPEPYNISNAAAAITACRLIGATDDQLQAAMPSFPGIPGRMQPVPNKLGINLIVDFAHTPNALKNALESLRKNTKGKLIAVYGSAGLRDNTKRPLMGKWGSQLADEVILTAEDPRTESVDTIINQMISGATTNRSHIHTQKDRQKAINFAIKLAKKGDTVGIFGKGHEKSMCFGTTEYPWSDFEAAVKASKIASNKKYK